MGRFIFLIAILTTFFSSLMLLAGAVGALQPMNPVLAGFGEGCEDTTHVCWYGVTFRVTTIDEAHHSLTNRGFSIERRDFSLTVHLGGCRVHLSDGSDVFIKSISLEDCGLQFYDFINKLGAPGWVAPPCYPLLTLAYDNFDIEISWPSDWFLSPNYEVYRLEFWGLSNGGGFPRYTGMAIVLTSGI